MKTRTVFTILLTLIIPLFAYGVDVNNPSMEGNFISQPPLGDVAQYWTGWRDSYEGFSESAYAHDANKSQEVHWTGSGGESFGPTGIYQQIGSLQPGQSYRISVWFKFHFSAMMAFGGWASGDITCSIGTDPNGGTDPDVVTNWAALQTIPTESRMRAPGLRG